MAAEPEILFFNQTDFRGGYAVIPAEFPAQSPVRAWVVVDVHGAGGLKAMRDNAWISEVLAPAPIILLVPSFSDGYQNGNGKWADQLMDHFQQIQDLYPVHGRMFLHGHSGGAQFVHRFAFHAPEQVIGVSAHSAGSWAGEPGFGDITNKATSIPFLISCGENDTDYSMPRFSYTRIEWYHRFARELKQRGFVLHASVWPNTGHGVPHQLYQKAFRECFRLATQGEIPPGEGWKGDLKTLAESRQNEEAHPPPGNIASPAYADPDPCHEKNPRSPADPANAGAGPETD